MSLASSSYSYPILGAFWTIFMIFLWVIWFWILITIFIDLFRSHDLSGWVKALWFIFILLLPLIGVLVYLIARGGKMHEHAVRDAQAQEQQFRSYGNELWEFDEDGLMRRREASINDVPIDEGERRIFGPRPEAERGQTFPLR